MHDALRSRVSDNPSRHDAYQREEAMRMLVRREAWPALGRMMKHLEKRDVALFAKEAQKLRVETAKSLSSQFTLLNDLLFESFNYFTFNKASEIEKASQRITKAGITSAALLNELAREYFASGRTRAMCKQIRSVRRDFLTWYPTLAPLLTVRMYGTKHEQRQFTVHMNKDRFKRLAHFYEKCYDLFSKLVVPAIGVEWIIDHHALQATIGKRTTTLWDVERTANLYKRKILERYPIAELFNPCLRLSPTPNVRKNFPQTAQTDLCDKILWLFSRIELASLYQTELHRRSEFRL